MQNKHGLTLAAAEAAAAAARQGQVAAVNTEGHTGMLSLATIKATGQMRIPVEPCSPVSIQLPLLSAADGNTMGSSHAM